MKRVRLTMSQALVKFLDNQYIECDGVETKFVSGMFGIFGHGCVVGVGQALEQGGHNLGDAGGVFPLLLILPKDDPPRIGVHQYGRLGLDLQRRQGVGLRGQHQTDHQHGQQKNR